MGSLKGKTCVCSGVCPTSNLGAIPWSIWEFLCIFTRSTVHVGKNMKWS